MATKYINLQINETDLDVYARIQQESSGNWYKNSDGSFGAYDEVEIIDLLEDSNVNQKYSWNGGNAAIWTDGRYYIYSYNQIGSAPDDNNDEAIGIGLIIISADAEITLDGIWDLSFTEPSVGSPPKEPSFRVWFGWLWMQFRNKLISNSNTGKSQIHSDGGTELTNADITDSGGIFTRDKYEAP